MLWYEWFALKWLGVRVGMWDKVLEKEVGRGIEKTGLALSLIIAQKHIAREYKGSVCPGPKV